MKTILVTGGAGFIGSNLCEALVARGDRVISLDNYFTGRKENHVEGVDYVLGHTKNIDLLIGTGIDLVYHLGEYSRVEKSFDDVARVWDLNKVGTFAVLEFCRRNKIKLVYSGSSTKFSDGSLGRNQSPYAWSKSSNTDMVKNYGDWFGLEYAITYFYNVYGKREITTGEYATVIGIFRDKMAKGEALTVVSPGTQKRNFTHIDDIISGLILVGENGTGDDFGIGAETPYTIMDIAKMFTDNIVMIPERQGNRMDSELNTDRTKELGWKQTKDVRDYINEFTPT